jgi:hypothetical protein
VRAVRASGHNLVTLAVLAQFAAPNQLSTLLNARTVRVSPLVARRLCLLAQVIQYEGPIFKEDRRG